MINKRILFLLKLPPPLTGATLMNKMVEESKILHDHFNIRTIPISYAKSVADLGEMRIGKLVTFIKLFIKLFKETIFTRPDLVYFQLSPLGIAFYRDIFYVTLLKLFNIDILYHMHGKGIKKETIIPWKKKLYTFAFNNENVICLSNSLTFDVDYFNVKKIFIVNNGIPEFNKTVLVPTVNVDQTVNILFLSNLIYSKGILDYLDSLSLLLNRDLSFKGVIVGNEADLTEKQLVQEINKRGLARYVDYLGPKYGEEKEKILRECDIFAFPTKNDVWGNVILEAMQAGKPVVASDEGAISEIIDPGITGFVVPKSSPEEFSEKLEILISQPELRKEMGINGRAKFLNKYTETIFIENLKNVFIEVLNPV